MASINFCPNCGENLNHLDDTAVFCAKCGIRLKKESTDSVIEKNDSKTSADSENIKEIIDSKKNSHDAWIVITIVLAMVGILYYLTASPTRKKSTKPDINDFSMVAPTSTEGVKFVKINVEYDNYTNIYTIHCKMENKTGRLISYMDLKGVFYDNKGNIIGTGFGNETNFPNGYTKVVDIIATGIVNPKSYDVQIGNVIYE